MHEYARMGFWVFRGLGKKYNSAKQFVPYVSKVPTVLCAAKYNKP